MNYGGAKLQIFCAIFIRVSLGQRLEKVKGHEEAEPSTSLGSKEHTFTMHKVSK